MSDMNVLFPAVELDIGGEKFAIQPLKFGQIPKAMKLLKPVVAAMSGSGRPAAEISQLSAWVDILAEGGEEILQFVSFASGKAREWIDGLDMDDGVKLLKTVYEVNADFFAQRLLPLLGGSPPAQDGEMSSAS